MRPWAETRHFRLDGDGRLGRVIDPREDLDLVRQDLGPIASAEVPPALFAELAELRAEWRAAPSRAALHADWNATYFGR